MFHCQQAAKSSINVSMSTVGQQLRTAREARNLTIQEVAEATKIRSDHLRALEEETYDVFSAPVYIRGFIRTYATFLKLDAKKLVEEVKTSLAGSEKHRENPSFSPSKKSFLNVAMYQVSKVNWRIGLPLVLVAALLLGAFFAIKAWSLHRSKESNTELS